jgi:hypothetical protein
LKDNWTHQSPSVYGIRRIFLLINPKGHVLLKSIKWPLAVVAAIGLTACEDGSGGTVNIFDDIATVSGGGGQSAEQRALAREERQYATARLTGAAIGAGLGVIACQLRDCSKEQTATAAVLGGTAGYVGGVALTRQNQDFRVSQESLNRDISVARAESQNLASAAASAERVVAFQQREISRLNAGLRAGTVTRDEYRASYRNMQGDLQATQSLIENGNERQKSLNSSITAHRSGGLDTSQLQRQRDAQQRELARLRNAERSITNALRSVPPEVRSSS